ncbi:MAG: DUF3570 domain-containing protein [Deltaproteobacteria bacterium]|nr:DUF3570 domain-containing protein [Deltaproteobacteria bacterium]
MRVQLKRSHIRRGSSVLLALGFLLKGSLAWAQSTLKYKHLRYKEDEPLVQVDEDVLEAVLEFEGQQRLEFTFSHDAISGATPTGVPAQASLSGASSLAVRGQEVSRMADSRNALTAGVNYPVGRFTRLRGSLYKSVESDYHSRGLTLGGAWELNEKNTTIQSALSTYTDQVVPPGRANGEKRIDTFSLGVSQVLSPSVLVSAGVELGRYAGLLSDPYKDVLLDGMRIPESRPPARVGEAGWASLRAEVFTHHALNLLLRGYVDDWGIQSVSWQGSTLHDLNPNWLLELFYRHYEQSAAYFWADSFSAKTSGPYRSADIRLSKLSSDRLGLTAIYRANEAWWLEGSLARYGLSGVPGLFAGFSNSRLIGATVASVAIQYRKF